MCKAYQKNGGKMKIKFTEEQTALLKKMGIAFSLQGNLDNDHLMELDMVVTDYMIEYGIEEDETVNEVGKLCEQILEKINE